MRSQRAGQVIAISSVAGLVGQSWCSAYAAAKFGLEGFIESLATEVDQFGITTTIVEPGFFRTELLTPESMATAELSIDDYAAQSTQTEAAWRSMNGRQGGDPAKLANGLVHLAGLHEPPARWVAGADAIEAVEGKANTLFPRSQPTASSQARSTTTTRPPPPDRRERACVGSPQPATEAHRYAPARSR